MENTKTGSSMEIERKFLVSSLPGDLENYKNVYMEQSYLSHRPTKRIRMIRYADGTEKFVYTEKGAGKLCRSEEETEISKEKYLELAKLVVSGTVQKKRYYIPLGDSLCAELDVYLGGLTGLYTVEVEFESVDDANAFTPLVWFGEDVTEKPGYSNSALAAILKKG